VRGPAAGAVATLSGATLNTVFETRTSSRSPMNGLPTGLSGASEPMPPMWSAASLQVDILNTAVPWLWPSMNSSIFLSAALCVATT
jgi:hypothetical protein